MGLQVNFIDMCDLKEVEENIKPNTKAIWIETPTNPTLKICDIKKICDIAKEHNIVSVVDNTFCSPVIQSPLLLGADFVMNSCTKYIGGHADILMGSMTTNNKVNYFIQMKFFFQFLSNFRI
jgi:cystathionine beta-lyase/cystathionine gamma-synthase